MDKTAAAVVLFDQFASAYQEKFMDVGLYTSTLDAFCHRVNKHNAKILELACGPGNITRYLLDKRPDLKVLGTDLSENMIALARANNPEAQFEQLDCRKIGHLGRKFDGIVCGFGMPYLSKEECIAFIRDASKALLPGGAVYLSTMEGGYERSGLKGPSSGTGPQIFIHYHQENYLVEALKNNGFRNIRISRVDQPEPSEESTQDIILVARKNG